MCIVFLDSLEYMVYLDPVTPRQSSIAVITIIIVIIYHNALESRSHNEGCAYHSSGPGYCEYQVMMNHLFALDEYEFVPLSRATTPHLLDVAETNIMA